MKTTTTTTVKPINTAAMRRANLGAAVKAWLDSGHLSDNEQDEADIALEAALIANGAVKPEETIEGMYAAWSAGAVHIVLDFDAMEVDMAGNISRGV